MIKNFKSKEAEKIFNGKYSLKIPHHIQRTAMRKLWMINAAQNINDLKIPLANRLEKLKGSRKNQYSIRINEQWRICFRWSQGNAHDLEIIDYHY